MTKKEELANEYAQMSEMTKDRREIEIAYEAFLAGWGAREKNMLDVPHPKVVAYNGYLITIEE